MTNNAYITSETHDAGSTIMRGVRQLSPFLCAAAAALFAIGVATGCYTYLHRSPVREAQAPGTNAWTVQLVLAAMACAWYGVAAWRHGRRFGPHSGRLLLAPLGRHAAARLAATTRRMSWRTVAAIAPLGMIGYDFWRVGYQVTNGLDPNQVVNAWGGPTYLGAMAAHYLDCALITAASAWLLARILLPPARADAANRRITDALATQEAEPEPGARKTATPSRHREKWQVKGRKGRAGT